MYDIQSLKGYPRQLFQRVFLAGGNGFIGSHILAQLLDLGHSVTCAVRSQVNGDSIPDDYAAEKNQIDIAIVPYIIATGSHDTALKSDGDGKAPFDPVFHTAPPFSSSPVHDHLEVLEPAIRGTPNILAPVKGHAAGVKRVIVTGSDAGVVDYDRLASDPPHPPNEDDLESRDLGVSFAR